jgi:hypothetical protein
MFGICSECGNQEESKSAKCPSCNHNWHLFPTRPKDVEFWLQPKGYWDRARRCFPPGIFYGLCWGVIFFLTSACLDAFAAFNKVHLTSQSVSIYIFLVVFDLFCAYLGIKTLRVSMKHFKLLRIVIFFNILITSVLFYHSVFEVVGAAYRDKAALFLLLRFLIAMFTAFLFYRGRVFRAILRHA